jgi:hypothetical protein
MAHKSKMVGELPPANWRYRGRQRLREKSRQISIGEVQKISIGIEADSE